MALLPSQGLIIAFCIFTLHSLLDSIRRVKERWSDGRKKSEESHARAFFFFINPPPLPPLHLRTCTSSSHRCPSKAASLLFLYPLHLGKISLRIGKGTPGPLTQASPFSPLPLSLCPPPFWIIDSCCLVIHRLHMPANSSGGGKLPSPATLRSTPNTHTTNHASRRALSHTCARAQTPQVWVKPRHIHPRPTTHHHHHHLYHWPLKSQELGMRRGSKRHVSR